MKKLKICLESADGGHLDEMLSVMDAFEGYEIFFITFERITTKSLKKNNRVIFIRNLKGKIDPIKLPKILFWVYLALYQIIMLIPSYRILKNENPEIIFSTGGGITIPLCYIGKIMGKKIIYMESLTRLNDLSGTGKLIYPISDLFLVQWKKITDKYTNAKYWGKII